jgi:hypothetical protein
LPIFVLSAYTSSADCASIPVARLRRHEPPIRTSCARRSAVATCSRATICVDAAAGTRARLAAVADLGWTARGADRPENADDVF